MVRKVFLILILFSFSFFSYAQLGNNINYSSYISNESSLVKSYTDSLLLLRKRILNDSTGKYKHFKKDISEEARLFCQQPIIGILSTMPLQLVPMMKSTIISWRFIYRTLI